MIELPERAQQLLDGLVEERGGASRFSSTQLEVAVAAVRLMGAMRTANTADLIKAAAALSSILAQLPPVTQTAIRVERIPKGNLHVALAAYQRMMQEPGLSIEFADDEPQTIDATVATPRR